MSFVYDITTSKKDNTSSVCLTVCHLLFNVINLFVSTFLIAHIYSLTDNLYSYVINVGLYELSCYVVMLISYYLFSFIVDKTNRIWIYRLGKILLTALVIVTIFLGEQLAELIVLAGALFGLAKAAYYSSYNVLKQEMVSRKSMRGFAVVNMILTKLVNVVCPILLGMLIDVSTFSMVAIYVFIICLISIIVSFFIKVKRPENSDFQLKDYLVRLKKNPELNAKMKDFYKMCIVYGFVSVVGSLLSVNVMMHFGSNFSLGLITGICSCIAICILIAMNKFTRFGKRSWVYILCSVFILASSLVFAIIPSMITLIIYHVVKTSAEIVIATSMDIVRNRNLKEAGFYNDIAEHQCVTESIFQFSRIFSYGSLILISLLHNFVLFQIIFVIFNIISFAVLAIMMCKFEKKYWAEPVNLQIENKQDEEK